jgi:hypothetical protein
MKTDGPRTSSSAPRLADVHVRRRRLWLAAGVMFFFFCFPAFLAWNFLLGPMLTWRDQYTQLIGKPEADVTALLGPPKFRLSPNEVKEKGIDFPWRDMRYQPVPERSVHRVVLLYTVPHMSWLAAYVFIGNDDRVEAIDFAGT